MNEPIAKKKAEAYLAERGFKLRINAMEIWVPKRARQFSYDESAAISELLQYFSDQGVEVNFHFEKA